MAGGVYGYSGDGMKLKVDSYSLQTAPWANRGPAIYAQRGNTIWPMVYLRKPKHISQKDFNDFLKGLNIWVKP